jgi:hypothetical protein
MVLKFVIPQVILDVRGAVVGLCQLVLLRLFFKFGALALELTQYVVAVVRHLHLMVVIRHLRLRWLQVKDFVYIQVADFAVLQPPPRQGVQVKIHLFV